MRKLKEHIEASSNNYGFTILQIYPDIHSVKLKKWIHEQNHIFNLPNQAPCILQPETLFFYISFLFLSLVNNQHREPFHFIFVFLKKTLFILFLLCLQLNAIAQLLTRGPYMTMATQHGVTITWRTNFACNSKVMYGQSVGAFMGGVVNNNLTTEHVVKLTGLLPDTKYYYTIGTSNITLQGDTKNYFRTLPLTSPAYNKTIRILAVGDVAKATVYEEQMRDAFLHYIDTNYVDGYLMLGDNAYPSGQDTDFQNGFFNYFEPSITAHTVLWPALGNHEYANTSSLRQTHAIPYFDIFTLPAQGECGGVTSNTEMYYSFNIGNAHFINLDSYGLEEVSGNYYGITDTAVSPQIQWLIQDLTANTLPWVIVSFHHAPYCMGTHNSDTESDLAAIREHVNPILERYNVDLVLNGHDHTYERSSFMHHHYGLESTFDSTIHIVQHTSALNDATPFSCPIIKNSIPPLPSDSGLLYIVIGSGSDYVASPQITWPHNAMYYSNYDNHGSLLLTIKENKLRGEWISTDTNQVVKDHFTMYKNVNRKNYINVISGQPITLSASWDEENDYVWSTGDTSRQITISTASPLNLTVSDKNACLTDSFFINIITPLLHEEHPIDNIQLSPNPVQDQLTLSGLDKGSYMIKLIAADASTAFQTSFLLDHTHASHTISLQQVPNGQYVIELMKDLQNIGSKHILIAH